MKTRFSKTSTIALATILIAGLAAGCSNDVQSFASPNVTNAPAPGFENFSVGSEEDFIINVGRRTYFKAKSAELDGTAKITLDRQAQWLAKYPSWKIKIQGFADDPGNEAANVAISRRRAEAVMNYLTVQGVARDRMWLKGYGRERIVKKCPDITCKSQNRRVISNLREEFES